MQYEYKGPIKQQHTVPDHNVNLQQAEAHFSD